MVERYATRRARKYLMGHAFVARPSGRHPTSCVICGRMPDAHAVLDPETRPRDLALERELTDLASRAAGRFTAEGDGDDRGMLAFAHRRALPGGVRESLDPVQEISEELADGLNYCNWGIERVYQAFLAGDDDATHMYDRLMRCSTKLVEAWHELHTRSA